MATAALTGRLARIRASTAAASTATTSQTALAELQNYTLTVSADTIDVTSHDSSGWKETLTGIRSWTWSADVVYLSTGGGQGALRSNLVTGAGPTIPLNITFLQTTTLTAKKWQGKTRLTSFELSHGTNDSILGKMSGVGTAALTRTA